MAHVARSCAELQGAYNPEEYADLPATEDVQVCCLSCHDTASKILALRIACIKVAVGTRHLVHRTNNVNGGHSVTGSLLGGGDKLLLSLSSCSDWCLWFTWCHLSILPVLAWNTNVSILMCTAGDLQVHRAVQPWAP